jgi:transcriptional regulator with XRE-family HTH domain
MSPAGPAAQRSAIDLAFGKVLRSLRIERGFSQESLGHASGSGRTYVGQLERGERGASLKTVFALSAVLGIETAEVVRLVSERISDLKG